MKSFKSPLSTLMYNLRWLRRKNQLSQKAMAQLLGISVSSLRKLETGSLPPRLTISFLFQIQRHFHISPGDMLEKRMDIVAETQKNPLSNG